MPPIHREELLKLLDHDRRSIAHDGLQLQALPHVTRIAAPDGSWRAVIHSALDETNADAIIAQEVEHCLSIGAEHCEWKLFAHDRPADLMHRLERHGFVPGALEAVLVLDLSDPPGWVHDDGSSSPRVVRVDRLEQLDDFQAVIRAVFTRGHDFAIGELTRALATGSVYHRGYIAYAGDTPVSVGRLHSSPHSAFGGLFGGATLPEHRGRGFYRALVAARARDASALGCRYLIVDAAPTSRPILQRLGFIHLTDTWPCEWTRRPTTGPAGS